MSQGESRFFFFFFLVLHDEDFSSVITFMTERDPLSATVTLPGILAHLGVSTSAREGCPAKKTNSGIAKTECMKVYWSCSLSPS